jgi:hypothetical protein
MEPKGGLDPSSTLEKMKGLLQARDDTSRFVGLALLKSVLDNGQLSQNPENLMALWEAISSKFLDRLLRAPQSAKINKAESKDMVDLAVAVLHTFTILLPEDSRKQKRLTGRIDPLVKAIVQRHISHFPRLPSTRQLTCNQFSEDYQTHFTDTLVYFQSSRRCCRITAYSRPLSVDRNCQSGSSRARNYQLHMVECVYHHH